MNDPDAPTPSERAVNAPLVALVGSAVLLLTHLAFVLSPVDLQDQLVATFALIPLRVSAGPEGGEAGSIVLRFLPLLSSALLHSGWMHVGVNAGFLLAFGAPVARRLGEDFPGVLRWILLLCGSIVGGSLAFLLFEPDFPGLVVGASGGTSGLMAAAVVSGHDRAWRGVFTRDFLVFTLIFAISNLILTLVGPALLGGGLAWQAHLGGYVAGAGLMAVLDRRRQEGFF